MSQAHHHPQGGCIGIADRQSQSRPLKTCHTSQIRHGSEYSQCFVPISGVTATVTARHSCDRCTTLTSGHHLTT